MNIIPTRLDIKLTLITLVCMITLALAAAALVIAGFRQTQLGATQRGARGLEQQGRLTLERMALREAANSTDQIQQATALGQATVDYLLASGPPAGQQDIPLTRDAEGRLTDTRPARQTDLFAPSAARDDAQLRRDLRTTAALDPLLPALLKQHPDAAAIYYIGPSGLVRYAPVIGLSQKLPPDYAILADSSYVIATPERNPKRETVWRPPYLDPAGQGLLVTASTPVYADNRFQGVIGVDISLMRLIEHLSNLQPSPRGYAFLTDRDGHLVAASPGALPDIVGAGNMGVAYALTQTLGLPLISTPDSELQQTFQAMRTGQSGVRQVSLGGRPVYLAFAPVAGVGWSLGLVAPLDDITAQAQSVAAGIAEDADRTVRFTLLAMCVGFLLALIVATLLSRRMVTQPITALLSATRAVAAGRLDVRIPATSRDELGLLAASFNQMTVELDAARTRLEQRSLELEQANVALQSEIAARQRVADALREKEQQLEQRVAERTRELSTLLATAHTLASTLEVQPLLSIILTQLKDVIDYDAAALFQLENADELRLLRYLGPIPQERLVERWPLDQAGHSRAVVASRAPVIIPDVRADTPLARAFRLKAVDDLGEVPASIASWMGVPLIRRDQVIGVLSFDHSERGYYTQRHANLAMAFAAQASVAIENARLYSRAQQLAALQERQRLARELHDSVSQALFGIALGARTARAQLARDPSRVGEPIDYVLSLAEAGLAEMRALIFELRPESLEQEGLVAALSKQAAALRARHGISVRTVLGDEPELPLEQKEALYRIAQEALHNTVKHARASQIDLVLERANGSLMLEVRDNGQGFDPGGSFPGHLGLRSMRERAEQLGGQLSFASAPGQGTSVCARIPLANS